LKVNIASELPRNAGWLGTRARRGFSSSLFARARHASTTTTMPRVGKPFFDWCMENGERGKTLLREFRDPEKLPTELTFRTNYRAKWKCLKCKQAWRARMDNRTRSVRPSGCPKCANKTPRKPMSKTNNFLTWCNANGDRGKKLLREYVDPDREPTQVTKASRYKALWKCETCEHEWRAWMYSRTTTSVRPSDCPQCNLRGRKKKRQRDD